MHAYWSLYERNYWRILTDQDRCSRNVEDAKALQTEKTRQQSRTPHFSQAEFLVHLDNEAPVMSLTGFY
jgi:hypothetical protein